MSSTGFELGTAALQPHAMTTILRATRTMKDKRKAKYIARPWKTAGLAHGLLIRALGALFQAVSRPRSNVFVRRINVHRARSGAAHGGLQRH